MIFQLFASAVLLGVVVYAYSLYRKAPKIGSFVILLALSGEYLVLLPDHAMKLAHFMGIGRGADLVFYIWIMLSLVAILNLHLKLKDSEERLVSLVRAIALADTTGTKQ
jgi:hypothetical protein